MSRLTAQALTCRIGSRTILSDITLDVLPHTMTAIVGVNGVGKSTLMRVLAGLRPAASGQVLVDGVDLSTLSPRSRARTLAFVAQEETPPAELTLAEMIAMGRIPHRMPWQLDGRKERLVVGESLELVGLAHLAHRRCTQLSGGERRRAMLAMGLAQGTELLLLDEPTNHLDVHHQIQLLQTMKSVGRTIVATIHDLDLAMGWFDHVIVLSDETVLAAGPPQLTLTPDILHSAFKVEARPIPPIASGPPHLVIEGLTKEKK